MMFCAFRNVTSDMAHAFTVCHLAAGRITGVDIRAGLLKNASQKQKELPAMNTDDAFKVVVRRLEVGEE